MSDKEEKRPRLEKMVDASEYKKKENYLTRALSVFLPEDVYDLKDYISNYDGGNVTQLKIRLNATGEAMRMNIVKPNVPDYTIGELSRPNDVELIFDDSRDLDTFIDALLQLQKYHRESVGEWRVMK